MERFSLALYDLYSPEKSSFHPIAFNSETLYNENEELAENRDPPARADLFI
jgi:hypothetical protein